MTRHPEPLSRDVIEEQTELRSGGAESTIGATGARGDVLTTLPQDVIHTPLPPDATRATLSGRLLHWWVLFVAAALLIIIAPPVLLVSALAGRREWVYPFALWGGRAWLRLSGMKVIARGHEHLSPRATYIFIANHRSYLDTATLFCYVGRRVGLLAKKELLKVPILGYGMGFVNVLAIDRSNRERAIATVRAATERLRAGVSFGVFAEGTRALPGELLPFKKGAFHMAIEANAAVVPVAIKNTDALMGKRTGVARRGTIEIVILPPIETRGLSTARDADVIQLIAETRASVAAELASRPPV
jgi:1-acyl-sn-glycerol-3-phosphate acyltransferase